jgi:hypothetical protein
LRRTWLAEAEDLVYRNKDYGGFVSLERVVDQSTTSCELKDLVVKQFIAS